MAPFTPPAALTSSRAAWMPAWCCSPNSAKRPVRLVITPTFTVSWASARPLTANSTAKRDTSVLLIGTLLGVCRFLPAGIPYQHAGSPCHAPCAPPLYNPVVGAGGAHGRAWALTEGRGRRKLRNYGEQARAAACACPDWSDVT